MYPLKFEWLEGPHGVDGLKIIGAKGSLTFAPVSVTAGTAQDPFDRAAALSVVKSLAEALLQRLDERCNTHPIYQEGVLVDNKSSGPR